MTLYNPYNTISITGYTDDPALHKEIEPYISRINTEIQEIYDVNYKIADVHNHFLTNYANNGEMGDVTYFYPFSWFKLTRDPHQNQTGQNEMTKVFKDAFLTFE